MDRDIFVSTSKNLNNINISDTENNFFINSPVNNVMPQQAEPMKHINGYDSNILEEEAYKEVNDEVLKLEYKITHIEEELKSLDSQIQSAMDINDYILADTLYTRKSVLENDLKDLMKIYREASLSSRITSGFTSKFKDKINTVQDTVSSISNFILSKLPGKFSSFIEIRSSLKKLENINKSVDELMTCQYPYGEASDRYNQLSKYIARANSIQSQISKFMK